MFWSIFKQMIYDIIYNNDIEATEFTEDSNFGF